MLMSFLLKYLPKPWERKLRESPVYSRVGKGVFWSLVGSVLAQGLTLLSSIPVARLLGGESYGELGIVQSTISTFVIFAGPALGVAATKHIAELRNSDPERTGRIIGMAYTVEIMISALVVLFVLGVAPFLANTTLNASHLTGILRLAAVVLFFNGLVGVQNGILSGFEAFRPMAKVNLWRGLVSLPVMVVGAWLWRLPGAVLGLGVISAITVYANYQAIREEMHKRGIYVQYGNLQSEWEVLYGFSFPALLSSIVVVSATWAANAILVNQPDGYAEMGVFNAANQWRTAILFLPSVLSKPVLPMLSESLHRSVQEYKQVLKLNLVITGIISLCLAVGISIISPWIMASYGSDFSYSWPVLVMLALSATFSAIAGVIGNTIWSMGKMWYSFGLNVAWAIMFLGTVLLSTNGGALGLSKAYLLAYIFYLILVGFYVRFLMFPQLKKRDEL